MTDELKPIFGAGGYLVSNQGYVVNTRWDKPKLLKQNTYSRKDGIPVVTINGKHRMVSKLVWETFVGPIDNKHVIRHWDGNKENNCLENLFLCSKMEISNYRSTPVYIFDKKKNEGRAFDNITEASEATGIVPHRIWCALYREEPIPVEGFEISRYWR